MNPPDIGRCQLLVSEYSVGGVVHTVAASFHARHALRSPVLYGYVPPRAVGPVALSPVVRQPGSGDVHPW